MWGCAKKQSGFPFPAVRTAEAVPTGEGCSMLGASPPLGSSERLLGMGAAGPGSGGRPLCETIGATPDLRYLPLARGLLTWRGPTALPKALAASAAVAGFPAAGREGSPSIPA